MNKIKSNYVVCINNKGYSSALELKKIYQRLNDVEAEQHGQIRIIDESEEDYLYPMEFFISIKIPKEVQEAFTLYV